MAAQMHRQSFMDKVKHGGSGIFSGGWHGLEWTFDKLLRVNYAIAEGTRRGNEWKRNHPGEHTLFNDPSGWFHEAVQEVKGASRGIQGKRKTTFSDVLKEQGVKNKWVRGGAGFVLDVGLDPTTYLTFGSSAIAKGGARGGMSLAHAAGRAAIEGKPIEKKAAEALANAGKDFQWRKGLAKERVRQGRLKTFTEHDRAQLTHFEQSAKREEIGMSDRLPIIKLGRRQTPTHIKGVQVVPQLPRIMDRLAKTKFLGTGIGHFRGAFGAGKSDVIRGVRVTTKHTQEELAGKYQEFLQEALKTMPRKLDPHKAIKALSYFERKGGVKKVVEKKTGKVHYVLNENRIKRLVKEGKLTDEQVQFVKGWHGIAEHFRITDEAFGVKYKKGPMGEYGKLYVPHLMDRKGMPYTTAQKNMLRQQGYTKGRTRTNLSLEHIADLVKQGKLPNEIETDPYKILATIARTRSHQHADKSAIDFLSRAVGVPKKIVDTAAVRKIGRSEQRSNELDVMLKKFDTPSKRNLKQVKTLQAEKDTLDAEIKKLYRGKKNKEATKDMVELAGLKDNFGNAVLVEPRIAEALKRYEKILDPTEDASLKAFERMVAKNTGRWKQLVTAINPGYRARNTPSDLWNMYLDGVPVWAMGRYGTRVARVMKQVKDYPKYVEAYRKAPTKANLKKLRSVEASIVELSQAQKAGILAGQFGGDLQALAQMLSYAGSKRSLMRQGKFIKLSAKAAQDMNRNAENWGRLVHYFYRREHEGMSVADASWRVKEAHFDYEDLTPFERRLKGSLVPFYTWTRKNIPYQIHKLFTRPGKYAAFPKFATESEKTAGGDKGTILPDYMTKNFSFQVPGSKHTYITPQLGMGDLARFFEGRSNAMRSAESMVTPFLKVPAELAFNKSAYTGQEIDPKTGHPRQPISDWAAPFLSLIPGSNVGKTKRGGTTGMGASPYLSYAFGQTPWTRYLFLGGKVKDAQKGGISPLWSQFGGLQLTKINPEQQLLMERLALKDKLKRRMRGLRDEGLYPEAATKKQSDYERRIQRLIAHGLGR